MLSGKLANDDAHTVHSKLQSTAHQLQTQINIAILMMKGCTGPGEPPPRGAPQTVLIFLLHLNFGASPLSGPRKLDSIRKARFGRHCRMHTHGCGDKRYWAPVVGFSAGSEKQLRKEHSLEKQPWVRHACGVALCFGLSMARLAN
jgi:hypothetical protein